MAATGLSFVVITLAIALCAGSAQAVSATNLTVDSKTATTATLTWNAATAAQSYYNVVVLQDNSIIGNYTENDTSTVTYTITGLVFSTFYTADLHTVDLSTGQDLDVVSVSFYTNYDILNPKFFAAAGALAFIILTLVTMMILKVMCTQSNEAKLENEKRLVEDNIKARKEKKNTPKTIAKF